MASAVRGGRTRTRITTSRTSKFMSGNSDLSEFKTGLSEHLQKSIETKTFAATDAAPGAGAGADLIEVALEDYDATVADLSGDGKVLVMDFYTQWCGPCKLMKPTLVEWSESMASQGVSFRTFEASKKNAPVGKALGIKSVPTLIVYKDNTEVARVVGNKLPALKEAIEAALA
jgi:thioredoxin 1